MNTLDTGACGIEGGYQDKRFEDKEPYDFFFFLLLFFFFLLDLSKARTHDLCGPVIYREGYNAPL
jgi:hypothetical protein